MSDDSGSGAPEAGQDTDTKAEAPQGGSGSPSDGWNAEEWRRFAAETGLSPAKLQAQLGHARTWEQRAKKNIDAAAKAASVEQELEKLRADMARRDELDLKRAGQTAMTQVRAALAEVGVRADDVSDLLVEIEPGRLLKDGEPDDEAIARVVRALAKTAGRPTADPDQGRSSDGAPQGMGGFLRGLRTGR